MLIKNIVYNLRHENQNLIKINVNFMFLNDQKYLFIPLLYYYAYQIIIILFNNQIRH